MAALLGITYGANHYLEKQTRLASAGEYEWQWAGDGWIGYIDVAGDKSQIQLKKFITCNGQRTQQDLLRMNGEGKAKESLDGTKLEVEFPVTFISYDANCKGTDNPFRTVISGILGKTPSYAGRITYTDKYGEHPGDMILVQHYSH